MSFISNFSINLQRKTPFLSSSRCVLLKSNVVMKRSKPSICNQLVIEFFMPYLLLKNITFVCLGEILVVVNFVTGYVFQYLVLMGFMVLF